MTDADVEQTPTLALEETPEVPTADASDVEASEVLGAEEDAKASAGETEVQTEPSE